LSISHDNIVRADLIPQTGHPLIDSHATGFDETVGLSPRTDAVMGEKLIDTKLVGHGLGIPF